MFVAGHFYSFGLSVTGYGFWGEPSGLKFISPEVSSIQQPDLTWVFRELWSLCSYLPPFSNLRSLGGRDPVLDELARLPQGIADAFAVKHVVTVEHGSCLPPSDFQNRGFIDSRIEKIDWAGNPAVVYPGTTVTESHPEDALSHTLCSTLADSSLSRKQVRRHDGTVFEVLQRAARA